MKYDKTTIKKFILNYHKTIDNSETLDEDVGIDDFFNMSDQQVNNVLDNNNFEDAIFFNELETVVESVGTDKEFYLFLLLCKGVSYEKIGSIFGVKEPRVRQMFNQLLDKLAK
ncbi:sigma-70 family RNA polymerase sigma factor [Staphylococcus saprophyticus]|uniref:sigma-70 family RNA polymerase sigma factor n=1 Tax=Staphylococcus saprophyticus TaxID=29385 RepID=UPI0011A00461|nr:sigma-70 family RNA polymerase sigma factor [Staphylococcus saprophyticus]MDW4285421.1 sigma-70 family RNA polymerase sigma factor [Staphylococcus saprophyticus]MDW4312425.1 sigma-70 family RNA polymerase sigma factor [Staphylococcus saprophyticus]